MEYIAANPNGVTNSEIAQALGLESAFEGKQKNYLSYSLLGRLVDRQEVVRIDRDGRKLFLTTEHHAPRGKS
jgi:hypothetical protein